jgi:stearoyl-CoA desaturase (delta-9 desaturase)
MLFSGFFDLPWWGYVLVALGLTHITIASVTIFLHRHQAHRALELHPVVSHFFRLWLWLTTGMVTKEWAAIHRKHHAKCETVDDPHSPQIYGINRVLWGGVFLYVKESFNQETMERYGHGTPDDYIERELYSKHAVFGLILMGLINVALFGWVPGLLILATQIVWIPFWAAGVINGIGHFWGYRNFACEDASKNIVPWGILIGGEELHNNHHAFASSAKLSNKWYEFDIGWMYICILEALGLASVKKVAPVPRFTAAKTAADFDTVQAVITHRYDVMANYAKTLKRTIGSEIDGLRAKAPHLDKQSLRRWLHADAKALDDPSKAGLDAALQDSKVLHTVYAMRQDLVALWERSNASREQLVKELQDWCHRAEESGIAALREFSLKLRSYA